MQPYNDNKLPDQLPATSQRMLELRDAVLAEWEKRVRNALQEAKELRQPVFINTIPAFYDNLVEAIRPGCPRTNAVEGSQLAYEHGGERARLTNYDPETLILEYQIFRSALIDVLEQNGVTLSGEALKIINSSIDEAIREAVTAFSSVVTALREQFVAALTHDLRTPLGAASMAAELITFTTDPARVKELAQRVVFNLARMDKMLLGLLDTMIFQSGERLRLDLSHFDIAELVGEVCESSIPAYTARCQLIGRPVHGWWDREAMKRALENLVSNALKYGAPEKNILIKIETSHGNLVLSVHNEGLPIPQEDQETVFQVFRRASNAKEGKKSGWGVGLPYVRAVAESHGGSIVIDSALERGTTFTVSIPIDARAFEGVPTLGKIG